MNVNFKPIIEVIEMNGTSHKKISLFNFSNYDSQASVMLSGIKQVKPFFGSIFNEKMHTSLSKLMGHL